MCPFLDKAMTRCATHLTLRNLTQAIAQCANHYTACPIYNDAIENDSRQQQGQCPLSVLAAS